MENTEKKSLWKRLGDWWRNLSLKDVWRTIIIIIVIVLVLLTVPYLPGIINKVSTSLSAALYSVFVPAEEATMTVDKKIINSGEDFTVSFKRGDLTSGLFSIAYDCSSNVTIISVENNVLKMVNCNTPYYLVSDETNITLRATTINESVFRLAINGVYESNEDQKTETIGVVRVTVKNDSVGTTIDPSVPPYTPPTNTPATTTNNPPYVPPTNNPPYVPPTTPTYYGKPDLAVRVLQTGILNPNTNQIVSQNQFSSTDMVGIKFEVRNDGDANTGTWAFRATLPSLSTPNYQPPTQISLRPGESIIFTLGFSNLTSQSTNVISVYVDSNNSVLESNESNNTLSITILNPGYNDSNNSNNNNYNNNNYSNGCYVNGWFTYNCNGNNGGYNYLTVSCYADPSNPEEDERVEWNANVSGGDGDYDFDWTGTDGLNSSSENPSKTYTSSGLKYATVTVRDNGLSATQSCWVDVDDNNNNSNDDVDLAVEIIAVGRLSSSGSFIEDDEVNEGDDVAVRFEVTNEGDDDSGRWDYEVDLTPSFSGDTFRETNMSSIGSGDTVTVTVEFENASDSGTNRFRVEVDPDDDLGDDSRSNNDDSETIFVD